MYCHRERSEGLAAEFFASPNCVKLCSWFESLTTSGLWSWQNQVLDRSP
jgi:hypothetical protein